MVSWAKACLCVLIIIFEEMNFIASLWSGIEGDGEVVAYTPLPGGPNNTRPTESNESKASEVDFILLLQ